MGTYSTSDETRQALIHAAGELIAERGVGEVSTRAIAQRAGANIGTIHYHFGGKEGLLKEMLRFAFQTNAAASLPAVIEECERHLDDAPSRAQAVQTIVRHVMQAIFSPERPRWRSRVLYQVAQHAGPLRSFLREQVLDPHFEAITRFILRIRPEWTMHEVSLWTHMLFGPVVFYAAHCEILLDRFGNQTFPSAYQARLGRRLTDDAIRALGLPAEVV